MGAVRSHPLPVLLAPTFLAGQILVATRAGAGCPAVGSPGRSTAPHPHPPNSLVPGWPGAGLSLSRGSARLSSTFSPTMSGKGLLPARSTGCPSSETGSPRPRGPCFCASQIMTASVATPNFLKCPLSSVSAPTNILFRLLLSRPGPFCQPSSGRIPRAVYGSRAMDSGCGLLASTVPTRSGP